jgi:hypothetical protein
MMDMDMIDLDVQQEQTPAFAGFKFSDEGGDASWKHSTTEWFPPGALAELLDQQPQQEEEQQEQLLGPYQQNNGQNQQLWQPVQQGSGENEDLQQQVEWKQLQQQQQIDYRQQQQNDSDEQQQQWGEQTQWNQHEHVQVQHGGVHLLHDQQQQEEEAHEQVQQQGEWQEPQQQQDWVQQQRPVRPAAMQGNQREAEVPLARTSAGRRNRNNMWLPGQGTGMFESTGNR